MSDISKYTVVETKGWCHAHSTKLFTTKEAADYDWATYVFKDYVTKCCTYNEFNDDDFLDHIPNCEDLREALTILGKFMINYPKS